jgi:hypothetical protein
MMWVSVGLAAACAVLIGLEFYPLPDWTQKAEWLLLAEALFAGPMIIAGGLSMLMRRVEARRVLAGFQVGYVLIGLAIYHSTFTGEQDAQYQLALLFIPLYGYLGIVGAGIIAACLR